ncbi:hypothetical protein Pelo_7146 [Pelomyxa schiedti]|nr:hypothetical protein Pelo_7146 [Pelomyxa schiedti]
MHQACPDCICVTNRLRGQQHTAADANSGPVARGGVGCATAAVDAQVPMTDSNPRTAAAMTTSGGGAVSVTWAVVCPVCGSRFPVISLAGMLEVENSSPEESGLLSLGGGGDAQSGYLVKVLESVLKIDPLAVSENLETVATPVNCGVTEASHEFFTVKHVIQSARKELSKLCTSLNLCKSRLDSAIVHLKSISDDSELREKKISRCAPSAVAEVGEQQTQLQGLVSSIDESVRYCEVILRELEADPMALLVKKQIKDHLTEHLPVAEKRLWASLKGILDALIKQCTEVLEVKSNAELQLKELQVQVSQCNSAMETGVQQSVKSAMENLRVCQVNLEKIATSKSKVLQDAVTESRNKFYVLSNSIALGKRLCSSFQQQSGGGGVKPIAIPSMKCPADGNASSFSFLDTFMQLQPIFEKAIVETPTHCAQSIVSIKPDDTTPEIKEVMDVVQEITKDKGRETRIVSVVSIFLGCKNKCPGVQAEIAAIAMDY